jgi:hypothetical protein
MVKHNDEIELLGQLVASLIRELGDKPSSLGTGETGLRTGEKIKTNQQTLTTKNTKINIVLFPFFYSFPFS